MIKNLRYGEKKEGRGIVDVLKEYPSIQIGSAQFFGMLPLMQNRLYSISSAPSNADVSLVVDVVSYKAKGQDRMGLMTGTLLNLDLNTKMYGFFRQAPNFFLPRDTYRPVIMIAAGSGIAPFRSFWQQRYEQMKMGRRVGKTVLFFGCRNKSMNLLKSETDHLEDVEWENTEKPSENEEKGGGGWSIFCSPPKSEKHQPNFQRFDAFSREKGIPKTYVQQLILKHSWMIYDAWQNRGGHIYVCGKIAMASGVEDSLKNILQTYGGVDQFEASEIVADMKAEKRYQEDIFGD